MKSKVFLDTMLSQAVLVFFIYPSSWKYVVYILMLYLEVVKQLLELNIFHSR